MATVLVDKVQYDDRLATGGRAVDYGGALQDLAQIGLKVDEKVQVGKLDQAQRDNLSAFQELEQARQSGQDILDYTPADKNTWTPGQTKAFDELRGKLDRNRSLMEQGLMTSEAFEARANALTRDAISRRPSLARELTSVSATTLGFDPRSDVQIEMARIREQAARAKAEYFDSPEYKVAKERKDFEIRIQAANPELSQEDLSAQSAAFISMKAKNEARAAEVASLENSGKFSSLLAAKATDLFSAELETGTMSVLAAIPTDPNRLAESVKNGSAVKSIENLVNTFGQKADMQYARMIQAAQGMTDPQDRADALSAANAFKVKAAELVTKKYGELFKLASDQANAASAGFALSKNIAENRQRAVFINKYGDNWQVGESVEKATGVAVVNAQVKAAGEVPSTKVAVAQQGAQIISGFTVPKITSNTDTTEPKGFQVAKPNFNKDAVSEALIAVGASRTSGIEPRLRDVNTVANATDVLIIGGLQNKNITSKQISDYADITYSTLMTQGFKYPMKEGADSRKGTAVESLGNTVAFLARGGAGSVDPEQRNALVKVAKAGLSVSEAELRSVGAATFADGSDFKTRATVIPIKTNTGGTLKVVADTTGLSPEDATRANVWANYATQSLIFHGNAATASTTLYGQANTSVLSWQASRVRTLGYKIKTRE